MGNLDSVALECTFIQIGHNLLDIRSGRDDGMIRLVLGFDYVISAAGREMYKFGQRNSVQSLAWEGLQYLIIKLFFQEVKLV